MIHICLGCPVSCITSPLHNWGETIWSALFSAYISDYGFSYYFRLSLIIRWAKHSPPTMYFRFPKALYAVYLGVDIRQKYCLKNNRTKVLLHYPGNSGRPEHWYTGVVTALRNIIREVIPKEKSQKFTGESNQEVSSIGKSGRSRP